DAASMRVLTSATTSTLWAICAFCVAIVVLHRVRPAGCGQDLRCATAHAGRAGVHGVASSGRPLWAASAP
ncbi:MAG: hypothetical protein ACLQU9_07125, partial [Acidimicrobiales bacterium]